MECRKEDCKSKDLETIRVDINLTVRRCKKCGHVFERRPTHEESMEFNG